jgi:hypothetical protein
MCGRIAQAGKGFTIRKVTRKGEVVEVDVPGDWKADAWLLARLLPRIFGERRMIEHSGSLDAAAAGEELTDEQIEALDILGSTLDTESPESQPRRLPSSPN